MGTRVCRSNKTTSYPLLKVNVTDVHEVSTDVELPYPPTPIATPSNRTLCQLFTLPWVEVVEEPLEWEGAEWQLI